MIKKPLAYISAAWSGTETENMEAARRYCRAVYEAGFSPICPRLYLPLFIDDAIPREHKDGIDMARDMLRRSHVLIICGGVVDGAVKNEIAVAQRLNITATTLDGILTVKGQGEQEEHGGPVSSPGRISSPPVRKEGDSCRRKSTTALRKWW